MRVPFYSIYSLALILGERRREALLELVNSVSGLYPELCAMAKDEVEMLGREKSIATPSTDDLVAVRIENHFVPYLILHVWESRSKDTGESLATLTDGQRISIESALRSSRFVAFAPPLVLSSKVKFDSVTIGRRPYLYFYLKAAGLAEARASDQLQALIAQFGSIEETLFEDEVIYLRLDDEERFLEKCDRQLGAARPAA